MAQVVCRSLCNRILVVSKMSCLFKHRHLLRKGRSLCTSVGSNYYDVVVSGGGMAGCAMAAALAHEPLMRDCHILLLEGGPCTTLSSLPKAYSSQVCAISPGNVEFLSSFGAWQNIEQMRCRKVKKMQVWESCSKSHISFNQKDLTNNLAYIVENNVILAGITQQLDKVSNTVDIRYNAKVRQYDLQPPNSTSLPVVELEDGTRFSTKLLIGADGFRSLLRKTAAFHTVQWDYNQLALVAVLKVTGDLDNNVAWQRFLPTGPIAMLPLSDEDSCLIWTLSDKDAKNISQLSDESLVDAINRAFWHDDEMNPVANTMCETLSNVFSTVGLESGGIQQLPPTVIGIEDKTRAMFPLSLCHSSNYIRSRMALIGDAAHRVHPLAGQGVNLGFGDVSCLRNLLVKSLYNGQDIGDLSMLSEYESERQRNVLPIMTTVDGLNRLYSTNFSPLVMLRSLGLQTVNALSPLKNAMISFATQKS